MNESLSMYNLIKIPLERGLQTNEKNFQAFYFHKFIEYCDCKSKTIKNYKTFLKPFAKWIKENRIENPTRQDIKNYKKWIEEQPFSSGTKQQYFQATKHFFKWLSCEGLYSNIAEGFKGFKVNNDNSHKEAFTEEELQTIINSIETESASGKRNLAMILLAITGGLRIIELQRANIEDIQTIKGQKVLYIQGKGRDSKDEYIKIIPEVEIALQEYLKTRTTSKKSEPLFTSTSNRAINERITETSLSRIFKTIFRKSGFDSNKLTAHSLRHSSNTLLFKSGADIYKVQKHARHQNPKTTEIYLHAVEREKDTSEQDIFNQIFHKELSKIKEEVENSIKNMNEEELQKINIYINNLKQERSDNKTTTKANIFTGNILAN